MNIEKFTFGSGAGEYPPGSNLVDSFFATPAIIVKMEVGGLGAQFIHNAEYRTLSQPTGTFDDGEEIIVYKK